MLWVYLALLMPSVANASLARHGRGIILDVRCQLPVVPNAHEKLSSAVVMTISSFMGQIHTKLDVLVMVFSAISFIIACDQFRRAFVTWYATRKKTMAVVEPDV
jgi:hypothetical protein